MINIIHIIAWILLAIWLVGFIAFAFWGNRAVKNMSADTPFLIHWLSIVSVSLRWPVILYFAATDSDADVVK